MCTLTIVFEAFLIPETHQEDQLGLFVLFSAGEPSAVDQDTKNTGEDN